MSHTSATATKALITPTTAAIGRDDQKPGVGR